MCAKLLVTEEDVRSVCQNAPCNKLNLISSITKSKRKCRHCGAPKPRYTRVGTTICTEWPDDSEWLSDEERDQCKQPFNQREALSILRAISPADYLKLGFDVTKSHPGDAIMTVLMVPPPGVRPTITMCVCPELQNARAHVRIALTPLISPSAFE